jgi:branched-chain amino acid transport system ATP-binding protein
MSLLSTRALAISFGENRAVDSVDFKVEQGEVLALIGSNGAGKTTLVNLVSGLLRPDSGEIVFEGADVTRQSSYERIKAGIARSFQIVNLFDQLSCADNVALSIFSREGRIHQMVTLASRDVKVWDEAHDVLRRFGLDRHASVHAGAISHGERKLLDVAIAYALGPKLLFLDEPTSGVSTREKAPIMEIISSIVRAGGITVVIIEHDMDIVFRYSERIVVMHQGSVLADGTPDQIRQNDAVTTTLLGTLVSGQSAYGSAGHAGS